MAIQGLIRMILPYLIIAVLAYMAYRWFVGRAKAAGKAVVKGAKVAGKTVATGGKKLSSADDNMRKNNKVAYGATMLVPGVAPARLGKAVYRKIQPRKGGRFALKPTSF